MSDGILRRAHKSNCNLFKDGRVGGGNCDCVEDLQYHNKPQLAPGFGPATINKSGYDQLAAQLAPGFGPAPTADPVNHPKHYTSHPSGVECIQVTEHMNFNVGNAVKYLWRCDEKGAHIEDLKKAAWYVAREIQRREKSS